MILMISLIAITTFPVSLPMMLSSLLGNWIGMWGSCVAHNLLIDAVTAIDPLPPPPSPASLSLSEYHLVWSDDFDGDKLDRRKWYPLIDCSGRGNNELQCYTSRSDNVRVRNGQLELVARAENYGERNFTSGRVHASGPGWTYGWFEARARLTKGTHLWPAVWLVPTDSVYGPWPRSGEIDIMEARGQNVFEIESTIHYGSSRTDRGKIGSAMVPFPFDFSQDFHVFGFEWTNQSMRWFMDGVQYFETSTNRIFTDKKGNPVYDKKGAPFDQKFKWILNVAVGGVFFPQSVYGRISRADALHWPKSVMEVDWVRVFQKKAETRSQWPMDDHVASTLSPTTTPVPTLPTSTTSSSPSSPTPSSTARTTAETEEGTTSTDPSAIISKSSEAAATTTPVPAVTSQVWDEEKEEEANDKKNRDRTAANEGNDKEEKQDDKTKDSGILNEKKMNELLVIDRDNNAHDVDDYDMIAGSEDELMRPPDSDYDEYYL